MSNYGNGGRQKFNSPPTRFGPVRHQYQSTPKVHENSNFRGRSPYSRSPNFNNQHGFQNARKSSPYRQIFGESPKSFTSPTSPENWNARSNRSYISDNSSSSYSGDVSQLSSYNSSYRNSGSPYYYQNRNNRYQGKQSFQSPGSNDSNPGHSNDISNYVHPSMLEDPWKILMAEMETKS